MRWSTAIASVGLVVVVLGIGFLLAPYVLPGCSGTAPRVCASSFGPSGQGFEVILVGLGLVGVAIVAAIQELQDGLAAVPPKRDAP